MLRRRGREHRVVLHHQRRQLGAGAWGGVVSSWAAAVEGEGLLLRSVEGVVGVGGVGVGGEGTEARGEEGMGVVLRGLLSGDEGLMRCQFRDSGARG